MKGWIFMKKVLSLVLALCMMLSFVPMVQAEAIVPEYLDGEWDFKYYANANEVPRDVTSIVFEDKIQVPGAMELQGYGYPSYFYEEQGGWGVPEDDGVRSAGVYKNDFKYTGEGYLVFESVEDNLTVYLNDEKIAESKLGAIGTAVKFEGKGDNEIICVVERNNTGINKKDDFNISGLMGNVYVTDSITVEQASKKVEIHDNTLVIDGEEVVIKGIKYTPTHPEAGNAITESQIDKDLNLIKEYGFNAVWVSAAPDYFYEKAEELDLYVIDEANVNLTNVDRDMDAATKRVQEMVERHFGYECVIMWSVGSGQGGNAKSLVEAVKELDNRPVAQEVTFAPDFEVFGNTGGMVDWVATLGDGNVGGFVDEFADKELYYTQNAYVFDVKDDVTGETVTIDGEVTNYKGTEYLGDASFARSIDKLDKYTIVTEVAKVDGNRVIFENGNVKFEIRDGRARFSVGNARARADVQEGKIAAVYSDGEIQVFVNNGFAENAEADAKVYGEYKVGSGETAISYIEIYNDALSLDELLEGADKAKLISRVDFDDITIKEDKSYTFLAYGGDFGDEPNSYYKSLTGIFSSTREPHPEAEAFKALLAGAGEEKFDMSMETGEAALVVPTQSNNLTVWEVGGNKFTVSNEGRITSITKNGKELLTSEMYPTVVRENTISEYEMGIEQEERWIASKAEVVDNGLYVQLASTVTEGILKLAYSVQDNGIMNVSVQSQFSDSATKPTFIGFRGVADFDSASWFGTKNSTYPDRRWNDVELYTAAVSEMSDNYAVPQESGNRGAYVIALHDKSLDMFAENIDENAETLMFVSATPHSMLEFQVLDYSVNAMENADHDEDIATEDKAYFRVGGYIAGVSGNSDYKLNDNIYGFDFMIATGAITGTPAIAVKDVFVGDERYTEFTSAVKTYVYQTNEKVGVIADGEMVVQDEAWAKFGDYTVYFAPETEYLSDMKAKEATAEIAKDKDFSGNAITMSFDYWSPATVYDKGISVKGGSITYDVSDFTDHVFTAVVGKNSIDWRSMGGGFDRNMFDATVNVTIELDGVVVEEVKDISMRGGSKEVSIDVSNASTMTITVEGSGRAPQYEDAVLANAAFVPNGPIVVNFEKKDGKASITVLNTDEEYVDVVLTATENGVVTTEATSIGKGLYRTVEVKAGEGAFVKAYITSLGEVTISNE